MNIRDEKGSILVTVLIVMAVLALLSTVFIFAATTEGKQSALHDDKIQAYYYARSGVEAALEWLDPDHYQLTEKVYLYGDLNGFLVYTAAQSGTDPIKVEIEPKSGGAEIEIAAEGTYGAATERVNLTLALQVEQAGATMPPFDMALFSMIEGGSSSETAIKLEGSSRIIGTAGTNAAGAKSVYFGWSTGIDQGDLYIGPGASANQVVVQVNKNGNITSGSIIPLEETRVYPLPVFPDFPDNLVTRPDFKTPWVPGLYYEISADGRYNLIEVTSSRTLTIDLQGGTRIIRVGTLKVEGTIVLKNVGTNGKLLLYIDNRFTTSGNHNINVTGGGAGNPGALTIYLKGNNPFGGTLPNGYQQFNFVGTVFTESAAVMIGAGSSFNGHIITNGGQVKIDGSASVTNGIIYAPNALVTVTGSGSAGSIVANRFSAGGDAQIRYNRDQLYLDSFPFDIFPNDGGGAIGGGSSSVTVTDYTWQ
ncbi:MAG: hypothetical protein AB1767_10680 [Bacillota bacterium]